MTKSQVNEILSGKRRQEGPLEVSERWYDDQHCANGRDTNRWFHDGVEITLSEETLEEERGRFGGGGRRAFEITGASYAIQKCEGRTTNGGGYSRIGRVLVWEHHDKDALESALAEILFGEGADAEFLIALEDLTVARKWVSERYSWVVDGSTLSFKERKGRNYWLNREFEIELGRDLYYSREPVKRLFHLFGAELFTD
jgi:hypothetical protein